MGLFSRIKEGLSKTKSAFSDKVDGIIGAFTKIDDEFFEELEEILILSDLGAKTAGDICERLRAETKRGRLTEPAEIKQLLRDIIAELIDGGSELFGGTAGSPFSAATTPSAILIIGVNGAGKTTTIGKLANNLKAGGKKVIIGAADTFRAAAIEQLSEWANRADADIIKHKEGSDPASVVFDSCKAAIARNADVLIIDTAGRLHNKKHLMDELKKIVRTLNQQLPDCAVETLLVLDGTTGQNAVNQARLFGETADITGIVLTKLDGTSKGGIVIPIKNELGIPVKFIGVGEKIDDLQPFDAKMFADALLGFDEDSE
ncbi:MAG: signal recognition particle-docking protein FtsY [Oscillospiraceae bacterium]|jgi:fused signal recognition particle receptor|nr:signal recognition particle-docking protein FtsY [Oscillospiraceae bacterium]